jgi:Tripartite tricarboxylate transporter family receptor
MTFAHTEPWPGPTPIIAHAADLPIGSHDESRLRLHYPIGRAGMALLVRIFPCLVVLAAALTSPLSAQQWPTRPIRIVTGTPAGGSPDFVSRLLADKLSERLGQTVVVENSATTGVAAWNTVAKSQPDGYLISMLTGAFSARAAVAKALPYDPIKDSPSSRWCPAIPWWSPPPRTRRSSPFPIS